MGAFSPVRMEWLVVAQFGLAATMVFGRAWFAMHLRLLLALRSIQFRQLREFPLAPVHKLSLEMYVLYLILILFYVDMQSDLLSVWTLFRCLSFVVLRRCLGCVSV